MIACSGDKFTLTPIETQISNANPDVGNSTMSKEFNDILPLIGATLYSVQAAESVIIQAIVMAVPDREIKSPSDVQIYEDIVRQDALGPLLKRVRKTTDFSDDFSSKLEQFRIDRNLFIHHLLEVEGGAAPPSGPMPKTYELTLRLGETSKYIRTAFADLIVRWADRIQLNGPLIDAFREIVPADEIGISERAFSAKPTK